MECIDTFFAPILVREHPLLASCLRSEWKATIESLDFAPKSFGAKIKCGLGPLAYVARSQEELQTAEMQTSINNEATTVTAMDIHKTKHGTPLIPATVDGTINVLNHQVKAIEFFLSTNCPLGIEIAFVIQALYTAHTTLSNMADF